MDWKKESEWERGWWGNCCNSLGEEIKQITYMNRMGFKPYSNGKTGYNYDLGNRSVVDIGGGPVSALLKCSNFNGMVIDPCEYPDWIASRYECAGIEYIKQKGEDLDISKVYDLALIYNVLQHTEDPEKVAKNALAVCKELHIFEWVETLVMPGHPHSLSENVLNAWLGGMGKTEQINENGCVGMCYYGTFKGGHYGE